MQELLHNFGIDWRLLVFQTINFLILLFILKKFAYGPILAMFKKRREDIERGIRMSREAEESLRRMEEIKKEELEKVRIQSLALISKAESSAKLRKEEILKEANKKVEGVIADAKRAINEEKAKMGEEIYRNAEVLIRMGVEKTIHKMPTSEKDQKLVKEALKELQTAKT